MTSLHAGRWYIVVHRVSRRQEKALADVAIYQAFLVAGAGFEPATFGL